MSQNAVQLFRFTNGGYNVQWAETASLSRFYQVLDAVLTIAEAEQAKNGN